MSKKNKKSSIKPSVKDKSVQNEKISIEKHKLGKQNLDIKKEKINILGKNDIVQDKNDKSQKTANIKNNLDEKDSKATKNIIVDGAKSDAEGDAVDKSQNTANVKNNLDEKERKATKNIIVDGAESDAEDDAVDKSQKTANIKNNLDEKERKATKNIIVDGAESDAEDDFVDRKEKITILTSFKKLGKNITLLIVLIILIITGYYFIEQKYVQSTGNKSFFITRFIEGLIEKTKQIIKEDKKDFAKPNIDNDNINSSEDGLQTNNIVAKHELAKPEDLIAKTEEQQNLNLSESLDTEKIVPELNLEADKSSRIAKKNQLEKGDAESNLSADNKFTATNLSTESILVNREIYNNLLKIEKDFYQGQEKIQQAVNLELLLDLLISLYSLRENIYNEESYEYNLAHILTLPVVHKKIKSLLKELSDYSQIRFNQEHFVKDFAIIKKEMIKEFYRRKYPNFKGRIRAFVTNFFIIYKTQEERSNNRSYGVILHKAEQALGVKKYAEVVTELKGLNPDLFLVFEEFVNEMQLHLRMLDNVDQIINLVKLVQLNLIQERKKW